MVIDEKENDVTINFLMWCKKALDICLENSIKVALFKSKSPSCGNIEVYDGTFSKNSYLKKGLNGKIA